MGGPVPFEQLPAELAEPIRTAKATTVAAPACDRAVQVGDGNGIAVSRLALTASPEPVWMIGVGC